MQSLQARMASFQTKRIKRYPSKASSSTASVKWPHPTDAKASANTLAEAGFFFSPSWDDRDGVTCFLCGKELNDWDADDDPFEIHYTKCQRSCAWAVVRCGLTEDLDDEGRFVFGNKARLPSSKAMERARLATFGQDWWPHDGEPGHGATSIKMAQAGFVYTPQHTGDDTATCLYCNLSLSGWEKGDDPLQEHRRRDSESRLDCPFFTFSSKRGRSKAVQPSLPVKEPPPVVEVEQQSEDELAVVPVTDPPVSRAKRGKARSGTSVAHSQPRRKTRATRGRSVKADAPAPQRSPSQSTTVSREQEEKTLPDSHEDAPVEPLSLPGPTAPSNPLSDTTLTHPEPVMSLSPAGQPIIVTSTSQPLTPHERTLTLEQWIQQEIDLSHNRLLTDGRRQIELFKAKAVELRNRIDEL